MAFRRDVLRKKSTRFACISALSGLFIVGQLLWTEGTSRQPLHARFLDVAWYKKTLHNVFVDNSQDHIWFVETSYKRKLSARVACNIESTCRINGDFNVHLLSTGNISSSDCAYYRILSKLPNFRSANLNVSVALARTPLRGREAALNRSKFKASHLSDFLRYVVLWKRGGVYLDSDVIVMKSLKGIRNTVCYQSTEKDANVAAGILFFDKQHPILGTLINKCARVYNPYLWPTCGPALTSLLPLDTKFSSRVKFFNVSAFFPVPWEKWEDLFHPEKATEVLRAANASCGVHFWNSLSNKKRVVPGSGCAMDVLARIHCPEVYKRASIEGYF